MQDKLDKFYTKYRCMYSWLEISNIKKAKLMHFFLVCVKIFRSASPNWAYLSYYIRKMHKLGKE